MGLFNGKKFDLQSTVGKIQEKIADISQTAESTISQTSFATQDSFGEVIFCSNCGTKLNQNAKFCHGCGVAVGTSAQEKQEAKSTLSAQAYTIQPTTFQQNHSVRQQEYVGKILKCSNCGANITETTAVCPECGMRITGKTAVSSVQAFKEQLMEIESKRKHIGLLNQLTQQVNKTDSQKITLIKNFPIPNTVDDIVEFMFLAIANIDVKLSKNTAGSKLSNAMNSGNVNLKTPKIISDAWVSKMQQAYQKAEILFPNDPAFVGIQKIYFEKMKELKIKIK